MLTCIICHFDTELDDAVTPGATGRCLCLRCFHRETESERPMPHELRRKIIAALAQIEAA